MKPSKPRPSATSWAPSTSWIESTTVSLKELVKGAGLDMADDTLVFDLGCVYESQLGKVDSKNYGLPQTRQRGYLFVWRPDLVGKCTSTDHEAFRADFDF